MGERTLDRLVAAVTGIEADPRPARGSESEPAAVVSEPGAAAPESSFPSE